jgi:hypothetical protein
LHGHRHVVITDVGRKYDVGITTSGMKFLQSFLKIG